MELKEIYPGVIWSIQYLGDEKNIFAKRMFQWRDVEYLESYITSHKQFIENNPHWKWYSVEDIIVSAKKDASKLLKYINTLYTNTLNNQHPDLSDRFYILEKPPYYEEKKARRKFYGRDPYADSDDDPDTVFRLYAIRVDSIKEGEAPAFIITGGGIKLSDNKKQMKELNQEYRLMLSVQEWLTKQGIITKESLYTLNNGKNE